VDTSAIRDEEFPAVAQRHAVPSVTVAQMREVDRRATEDYGIDLADLMELAGAPLATLARHLMGMHSGLRVAVLTGPGNNGGGGLVAARHLANRGSSVRVILGTPVARLSAAPRARLEPLLHMGVRACVVPWDMSLSELDETLGETDLVIDAILGYSGDISRGGPLIDLASRAALAGRPVLSLDIPTGLDPDTGEASREGILATATMARPCPSGGCSAVTVRSGRASSISQTSAFQMPFMRARG
jgi:NAD(P)H-hydrate epimerase